MKFRFVILALFISLSASAAPRETHTSTSDQELYVMPLRFRMKYIMRAQGETEAERLDVAERAAAEQAEEDFWAMLNTHEDWKSSYVAETGVEVHATHARHSTEKLSVDSRDDFAVISPTKLGNDSEKVVKVSIELLDSEDHVLNAFAVDRDIIKFQTTKTVGMLVIKKTNALSASMYANATKAKLQMEYDTGKVSILISGEDFKTLVQEYRPSLLNRCSKFFTKSFARLF